MTMPANELHSWKALSPMDVTLSGMSMLIIDLHLRKVSFSMVVTPFGIVRFSKDMHPRKALLPMDVTLSGKWTVVNSDQFKNDFSGMLLT